MDYPQPKYKIGDPVLYVHKTVDEKLKIPMAGSVKAFIHTIRPASTQNDIYFEYGLSRNLPRAYSYGESPFIFITEYQVVLIDLNEDDE